MKVCAFYFSPEGDVPGTGRTDSKEWKEQAKGEMIVNSNYGTKQPPDTLNSSQLGNATKSFSFLCWACRARQIHPGEQLKPEQYLKMALWDKTGSAKRLITPQSWQFKFSLQELETPTGPGAVWGWQSITHDLYFLLKGHSLWAKVRGVLWVDKWLGLHAAWGKPTSPCPFSKQCRQQRVSILHWADIVVLAVWPRQMEQALGAALAVQGMWSCTGCPWHPMLLQGCNPFPRLHLLGSGSLLRNWKDSVAFPYWGEFRAFRDCSDYSFKHCSLL